MVWDKFSKMVHCDVQISKAPPVQFIDDFLATHAVQKFVVSDQGGELCRSPQMLKVFKKHNCHQQPLTPPTKIQLNDITKPFPVLSEQCSLAQTCQSNSGSAACCMLSASSIPCHLQAELPAQLKSLLTGKTIGHASRHLAAEFG